MFNTKQEVDAFLSLLPSPYFSPIVKRSTSVIADHGLIAQRDITPWEIVVINYGTAVNNETIDAINKFYDYDNILCVDFGKYLANKPFEWEGQWAYINHSCEPNAGLLSENVIIAIENVKAWEEVCIDYWTFETREGRTMECNCRSEKCRKIITAKDYLLPELKVRLGKYFSPYLKG